MKRTAYDDLLAWKKSPFHHRLVYKLARIRNTADKDSEGQILSKNQIGALSALHEIFASSLAARPRLPIQASVSSVAEISHDKYIREIPESSILATVSMKPLEGNAILNVDPYIAFSIADKLIGGIGERINSHQDFTIIATHVMEKVFACMLGDIRKAWTRLIDLQPELVRVNAEPQLVQIAPPLPSATSMSPAPVATSLERKLFGRRITNAISLSGNELTSAWDG